MIVYLIRHGQTEQNKKKCLQGQSDIELNEYGRELALKTANALKDIQFDVIFTSPLKRAAETAEIIRGERKIPIICEKRIMEISFGEYEGLSYGQETYNIPDKSFLNFFERPEAYSVPPGGEAFEQIIERTGDFWKELIRNPGYRNKTILLSTHGCALKAILANICGTAIENFWGEGVHKNCAVSIVEVDGEVCRLIEEGKIFYS